jgi:hypothetical protein
MSGNAGQSEVALPYYATMGSCIKRARFGFDETYPAWHHVLVERSTVMAIACALT